VVIIAGVWLEPFSPPITEVIQQMVDAFPNKPIAWCSYEGWLYDIQTEELVGRLEKVGKAAVFSSPDRAMKALAKLAWYSEFRSAIVP